MQERDEAFNLGYYIDLVFRRRWLMIIPFCVAMIVGIYLAVTLPRIYQSSTLILVRPQRVPESYVQSIVTTDIESRIGTIKQQILSRTNLEKVINQFNLFSDPGQEKMFLEDKIADMRGRIAIKLETTNPGDPRKSADAFSILFSGTEPELVMRVANGLATFFIDENIKVREAQAVGTTDFFEDELDDMRKQLEQQESRLRDYRKQHMGELPGQLETHLRLLDRLQAQQNEKLRNLRDEKDRLLILEQKIKENREILAADTEAGGEVSLGQLKQRLAVLESTYTDQHPDVIKLRSNIADLEAKQQNMIQSESDAVADAFTSDSAKVLIARTLREQLRQHQVLKTEIRNIKAEIAEVGSRIKEYQQRVERTPQREEELISLQRDYNNIRASYTSLLTRKLEANIAVNMEKKHAFLPRKPVSPNLKRLLMLCLLAGLGAGGGLIYVLEFLDNSLRRPDDFEADLGIPVLATVPKIYHQSDYWLRRVNRVFSAVSIFVAVCLVAGFAVLVFNGVEKTIETVRPYIALIVWPL
jgi:polysaccharide chain length determinant protein (PEP-CTERM system associated)